MILFSNSVKKINVLTVALSVLILAVTCVESQAEQKNIIEDAVWTCDLDCMQEKGAIRFLLPVSNPFFLVDGFNKYGMAYDWAKLYEEFLNRNMSAGVFLRVVLIPVSRDRMFDRLLEGYGDVVAANLTVTPERQALVDFTDTLAVDVTEIIVASPDAPPLTSLEGLSGKHVTVRKQSSYYEHLQSLNKTFVKKGLQPISLKVVIDDLDDSVLLAMINEGLVEYAVMDDWKPEFWKEQYPACVIYPDLQVSSGGDIAWAVRKTNPQLRASINTFMEDYRGRFLVDRIKLHKNADKELLDFANLTPQMWSRFRQLWPLFTRIGKSYDIKPVWLAGLAYVSSGFDPDRIGPDGEIGIMQLKPFIARMPEVGIEDISTTEANVEASAKYLRFLIDTYFSGQGMTPVDQSLFAMAAYYMGPEKIKTFRWVAGQIGQNPNKWFNEVAVVVSRRMGRDTERFVRAVGFSALAYREALDSGKEKWSVE